MVLLHAALTSEQVQGLRARHPYASDPSPILEIARTEGWLSANVRYLEEERARSAAAMRDLMAAVGLERVDSLDQVVDLIELGLDVFAPPSGFTGTLTRVEPGVIQIENAECPVYRTFEDSAWRAITACPSWHRRRGWFDALGVNVSDSVVGEKKWGDVACCSVIAIQGFTP